MKYVYAVLPVTLTAFIGFIMLTIWVSSCSDQPINKLEVPKKISKSEIIQFQESYGISFNAISNAVEDDSYYESAARKHIDKFYNFENGEVLFKSEQVDDDPYRKSYDGVLSYFIGKNKKFSNDQGISKRNWRKTEWNNQGIVYEGATAIVMGQAVMKDAKNKNIVQDYIMGLKRNPDGGIKLFTHKISVPCPS